MRSDPTLTGIEQAVCAERSNQIDYTRLKTRHYLGNYTRRLPVTLSRMMENAHDWEHLPFVHASSFSSIDLIDSGPWGWRAKLGVPSGGHQLIDLIVDAPAHYWVSTVISGMGQGTEIHTQAVQLNASEIDIDVRFYLPEAPADPSIGAVALHYLRGQYAQLYDEDLGLMQGRQSALDARASAQSVDNEEDPQASISLGALDDLDPTTVHSVTWSGLPYCLRFWQGRWVVHSAVCPHLLGPLDDGQIAQDGTITCPWHGYRFDVVTGANIGGQCKGMKKPPRIEIREGQIVLSA